MTTAAVLSIIEIIARYGIPAAQLVHGWIKEGKTEITQTDWDQLNSLAAYRSTDALTAAGIKIIDGKVLRLDGSPMVFTTPPSNEGFTGVPVPA